jgi:hypothetical protein
LPMETELIMDSTEKITKKEIAHTVEEAMGSTLEKLNITSPSKKTEKVIKKVSKEMSGQIKNEVKKQEKEVKKRDKKVAKAVNKAKKEITPKK